RPLRPAVRCGPDVRRHLQPGGRAGGPPVAVNRTMTKSKGGTTMRKSEAGFALILAMLALILLTFLGLTLTLTTSTELHIASNYRWSPQALYNAEAGIEIGKRYLQESEWRTFLPDARGR